MDTVMLPTEVIEWRALILKKQGWTPRNANKVAETRVPCDLAESTLRMCTVKYEKQTAEKWALYLLGIDELSPSDPIKALDRLLTSVQDDDRL